MDDFTYTKDSPSVSIIEKIEKTTEDACDEFYNDKKKFIAKIKKDKDVLNLTINSFLLKQKLYGLRADEEIVFCIIKALKWDYLWK